MAKRWTLYRLFVIGIRYLRFRSVSMALICDTQATVSGRALCQRLKKVLDRQQYEISIQACLSGKVFAKERIEP